MSLLLCALEEATQPALPELQPSPAIVIAKFLLELLSPQLLSRSALLREKPSIHGSLRDLLQSSDLFQRLPNPKHPLSNLQTADFVRVLARGNIRGLFPDRYPPCTSC